MTLELKAMNETHLDAAYALTQQLKWPHRRADWQQALLLGVQAVGAKLRMMVLKTAQHFCRIDGLCGVQADAESVRRFNPLQDIHVVGHAGAQQLISRLSVFQPVVPAGPRGARLG